MLTNVAGLLTEAARREPERTAVSEAATGRTATWSELEALVDAVAHGLSRAGMVAGYRLLLATGNRIEFVAAYLGALRAGAVVVPVNPRSTAGELIRVLTDSGARLAVVDEQTVDVVREAARGLADALRVADDEVRERAVSPRLVVVGRAAEAGETAWDALVAEPGRVVPTAQDAESLAVLLYTSGTSGRPRGAMLTHRALLANVEQVAVVEPPMIHGNDVVFGVLPLFHVYGLNAVLGQCLRQCARLVLVESFDPEGALDIIEDEAVSVLPVAPAVFAYWRAVDQLADQLADRLGSVRLALSGSAPLAPELITWFTETTGIALHQGYGLTEASPVVTSTLCSREPQTGSVGAALPGVSVRLRDEQGREPEGDDAGEIEIHGDNLFSGYWPDGADGPDEEKWYATGDVGFLDKTGDLFLVDRLKELVIVSGFNVYPSEVEEVIAALPEVAEVAVIGVPDERTGEAVVAYVTPATGVDDAELPGLVEEATSTRLARFKQPTVLHVVAELPYTVTGKVQKGRLRATERRRALGLLEQ